MAAQSSRLLIEEQDGIHRVQFVDRNILEEASIQQINEELGQLIAEVDNPKLLLDFENVEHLSSAALGSLITANNKIREKEGQLRLTHINPQIYEVFSITKLDDHFQIHDDADAALASFS